MVLREESYLFRQNAGGSLVITADRKFVCYFPGVTIDHRMLRTRTFVSGLIGQLASDFRFADRSPQGSSIDSLVVISLELASLL
jgi:hypothetical protein